MTITSERPAALPQPPPTPLRARPSGSQRYMPALDGLRAFAVTAVIAYHLNITHAGGGYLGADVFFVLPGFLITGLLVDERARTGRLVLTAFWPSRAPIRAGSTTEPAPGRSSCSSAPPWPCSSRADHVRRVPAHRRRGWADGH